jgi:hypothetical protein
MITCNCGETFTESDEAKDHLRDKHTDEIDNNLQEYIEEAIRDTYHELITETDDDEAED